MSEQIDELRALLGLHDRSVVSIMALRGTIETTANDIIRTYAPTGDHAYVLAGPKEKLRGVARKDRDGTITYTFTVSP